MVKSYSSFVDELRNAVIRETGFSQERIYFEAEGSSRTPNGDRLFIEFAVSEKSRQICGVFTRELYSHYLRHMDVNEIAAEIVREITSMRGKGALENIDRLESFQKAKDFLFVRLKNLDKHRLELKDAIYRTVGDLALILYMCLEEQNETMVNVMIKKKHAALWGINEDDLFEHGLHNMLQIAEPRMFFLEMLLSFCENYEGEAFVNRELSPFTMKEFMESPMGVCLSTKNRMYGAITVFLPGVAERLGELFGDDFYMVFTSIHEVMLHAVSDIDVYELKEILRGTIEEATTEQEFLTYHIYRYDREFDVFSCVL